MANVAICTPHAGPVPPDYYRHVLQMQGSPDGLQHKFFHVEIDHHIVGKARNVCIETARTLGIIEVYWFIDDDVLVPPHAGKIINEALQLGVVSGLYFNRRPPYTPQLYTKASEPEYQGPNTMYWPLFNYSEGLMVVDACGGGCLAIRADVLWKLEAAMKEQQQYLDTSKTNLQKIADLLDLSEDGRADMLASVDALYNHRPIMSPWFEFTDAKGEDMYFCERVKELSIVVWADTTIKCGHIAHVPIDESHFMFLKNNNLLHRLGPDGKPIDEPVVGGAAAEVKITGQLE